MTQTPHPEWVEDCMKWRGVVLEGDFAHWCPDWDGLPVDETCPEWPCACAATSKEWSRDHKDGSNVPSSYVFMDELGHEFRP